MQTFRQRDIFKSGMCTITDNLLQLLKRHRARITGLWFHFDCTPLRRGWLRKQRVKYAVFPGYIQEMFTGNVWTAQLWSSKSYLERLWLYSQDISSGYSSKVGLSESGCLVETKQRLFEVSLNPPTFPKHTNTHKHGKTLQILMGRCSLNFTLMLHLPCIFSSMHKILICTCTKVKKTTVI